MTMTGRFIRTLAGLATSAVLLAGQAGWAQVQSEALLPGVRLDGWTRSGDDDDGTQTFVREGRRTWAGNPVIEVRMESVSPDEDGVLSYMLRFEIDCARRRHQTLEFVEYPQRNLGGRPFSRTKPNEGWEAEGPFVEVVCGLPQEPELQAETAVSKAAPVASGPRNGLVLVPGVEQGDWSYAGGSAISQMFLRRGKAPTPGLAGVEVRVEQRQVTASLAGLSARSLSEVDCNRGRAREIVMEVYPGANLTGRPTSRDLSGIWRPLEEVPYGWAVTAIVCPTSKVIKAPNLIRGVVQADWTFVGAEKDRSQVFARRIATAPGAHPQVDQRIEFANDDATHPGASLSMVAEYDCVRGRSRVLRAMVHKGHNLQGESVALSLEPEWLDNGTTSDVDVFVFACLTVTPDGGAVAPVAAAPAPVTASPSTVVRLDGWTPLEEDNVRQYFWRREATNAGAQATVSLRGEFHAAQGDGDAKFLSTMFSFDLRCTDRAMRLTQTGLWRDHNLSGPGGLRPDKDEWEPVTPATTKESLMDIACGAKR